MVLRAGGGKGFRNSFGHSRELGPSEVVHKSVVHCKKGIKHLVWRHSHEQFSCPMSACRVMKRPSWKAREKNRGGGGEDSRLKRESTWIF